MRITVAIITRNRASQLRRCIVSLQKQSFKTFRLLIVDNGSTDNTKEIVMNFKKKIKIRYIIEGKIGRAHARNRVLEEVKSGILATIDDDCEAYPNWIENILNSHHHFPEAVAIQGRAISLPKGGEISSLAQFIHDSGLKDNVSMEKGALYLFNDTFLKNSNPLLLLDTKNASFKINALKELNIKFNSLWQHGEDFEFSKQILAKKGKIIFYPEIKVYHWERKTFKDFLYQRYFAGKEVMMTQKSWPKRFFPKRESYWWVLRLTCFFVYLFQRRISKGFVTLISMFAIQQSVYLVGKYVEYFRKRTEAC